MTAAADRISQQHDLFLKHIAKVGAEELDEIRCKQLHELIDEGGAAQAADLEGIARLVRNFSRLHHERGGKIQLG